MEIPEPYLSRFLSRRDTSGGPYACWPWTAGIDSSGYGVGPIGPNKRDRVHRIAVRLDGRDIPVGMTIDHLCRNRRCANPRHLDVVPIAENLRRARPYRVPQTHCVRGHAIAVEGRTRRGNCRACKRIDGLARYHRIKPPPKPPKATCRRGHPLSGENLYVASDGERVCRACSRLRYHLRKAAT